jgi:hypothetical protein
LKREEGKVAFERGGEKLVSSAAVVCREERESVKRFRLIVLLRDDS